MLQALEKFYGTPLGTRAATAVLKSLKDEEMWSCAPDMTIAACGYADPYLPQLADGAVGAMVRPTVTGEVSPFSLCAAGHNTITANFDALPFETESLDRLIYVHALEYMFEAGDVLSEAWRVLKGSGRLLVIVPNRHGVWAKADHTPFGNGMPFSKMQLTAYLNRAGFDVVTQKTTLFFLPTVRQDSLFLSAWLEWLFARLLPAFGGVHVISAEKSTLARIKPQGGAVAPVTAPVGLKPAVSTEG